MHRGATIAQWIRLRLPSCRPGFESQAHHLRFYQFILICVMWKNENKQKDARIGPFLELMHTYKAKTKTLIFVYHEAHLLSGPTPRPSPHH